MMLTLRNDGIPALLGEIKTVHASILSEREIKVGRSEGRT